MSEQEEKAKNWQTFEEVKSLKSHLASLEEEGRKFAASFSTLSRELASFHGRSFQFRETHLRILNPSRNMEEIAAIPWAHLNSDAIRNLLGDWQETVGALNQKKKCLADHGMDLDKDFGF